VTLAFSNVSQEPNDKEIFHDNIKFVFKNKIGQGGKGIVYNFEDDKGFKIAFKVTMH